ncbi:MAG TPA: hypothetical protein DHV36_16490 [Desulfobacteraceae bacterium]|nr:hypothetical protein [Desulfobacteraceae bacterium]|tara:strand:- start:64 stop:564 length:501 start_codon:yes stop_codon:yes gene_type:complete
MYTKMMHRAVAYQKAAFDTSFSIMAAFQDHGCEMMKTGFEKSRFVPEGSTKMCSYWMDFIKQNRANCKEYMDNGFDRINDFFQTADLDAEPAKASPAEETTPEAAATTSKAPPKTAAPDTSPEPVKTAAPAKKASPAKAAPAAKKAASKKAAPAKPKAASQKNTPQ